MGKSLAGPVRRLRSIRVVLDSFDLVEQVLGRPIHLPKINSFA